MSNRVGDAGTSETIDRCAADSAKGPRLQRLRAALFLIESLGNADNVQCYAGVETEGDVVVATAKAEGTRVYSEENKNFAPDGAFTFVSAAVINTVVIFIDQWISWKFSQKICFGLYTTVSIGKEKNAGRVKELKLELPDKPIIELLRKKDYTDARLLSCVIALTKSEYRAQYDDPKKPPGYASVIDGWDDETWKLFLSRITWLFCENDEAGTEVQLLDAIKKCPLYRQSHEGKEQLLASALVDLLDRKQLAGDVADRFVHASEVELLFRKVEAGEIKRVDPTWKAWQQLPAPVDQRNISEKFLSACPSLSKPTLQRYQRRTAAGLLELDAHVQDKSMLALRFQIFDACEDALTLLVAKRLTLSESELNTELDSLVKVALARLNQRTPEYDYAFKSEPFVRNVLLTLFDSCFLSLDGTKSD